MKIDFRLFLGSRQNCANLGGKIQHVGFQLIVNGLYPNRIPSQHQLFLFSIPDGQPEHTPQFLKNINAPLFITVDDDFRIRLCTKTVTLMLKGSPQCLEIVDFAIKDNDNGVLIINHGLVSAFQIDDRKPTEPKPKRAVKEITLVVGPPVSNRIRHILYLELVDCGMII